LAVRQESIRTRAERIGSEFDLGALRSIRPLAGSVAVDGVAGIIGGAVLIAIGAFATIGVFKLSHLIHVIFVGLVVLAVLPMVAGAYVVVKSLGLLGSMISPEDNDRLLWYSDGVALLPARTNRPRALRWDELASVRPSFTVRKTDRGNKLELDGCTLRRKSDGADAALIKGFQLDVVLTDAAATQAGRRLLGIEGLGEHAIFAGRAIEHLGVPVAVTSVIPGVPTPEDRTAI
jgi:hypothetical protein